MSPFELNFNKTLTKTICQAQWGEGYDVDLMNTLLRLDDWEEFMKSDQQETGWRIVGSEHIGQWWDREAAAKELEASRAEFWIAKDRLARDHTPAEVYKIIADHYARIAHYREFERPEKVELTIVAQLVGFLTRADRGAVPCVVRVAELIESLKFAAPLFMPETSAEEKLELMENYSLRPLLITVEQLAQLSGPDDDGLAPTLGWFARRIHEDGLFRGEKSNVQKKIRAAGLQLKSGVDKSSNLFGRPKRNDLPSSFSDA